MPVLVIHTNNGSTITAPLEAWLVALVNTLPEPRRQELYHRVAQMEGASLIPDKFKIVEDALGTITIVENPVIDLGGR